MNTHEREELPECWRYRFRNSETGGWHDWRLSGTEPVVNSFLEGKVEVQPLYSRLCRAGRDAQALAGELDCAYEAMADVASGTNDLSAAFHADAIKEAADFIRDCAANSGGIYDAKTRSSRAVDILRRLSPQAGGSYGT